MKSFVDLSGELRKKENGQTVVSDDLSALAPQTVELLNLWKDFRKVVEFIEINREWLNRQMRVIAL